jgi:hypothetical protein
MSLLLNDLKHTSNISPHQVPFAPVQTHKKRVLSCGFALRHWTGKNTAWISCSNLTSRDKACKTIHTKPSTLETNILAAVGSVIHSTTAFVWQPAFRVNHSVAHSLKSTRIFSKKPNQLGSISRVEKSSKSGFSRRGYEQLSNVSISSANILKHILSTSQKAVTASLHAFGILVNVNPSYLLYAIPQNAMILLWIGCSGTTVKRN